MGCLLSSSQLMIWMQLNHVGYLKKVNHESVYRKKTYALDPHHHKYTHYRIYLWPCKGHSQCCRSGTMGILSHYSFIWSLDVERAMAKKEMENKESVAIDPLNVV
jgi:hypothetical protein